jgi:CheY-like chemotaxis protein
MIRVLLADDAAEMRFLVRFVLEEDGRFEVVGDATDGVETLELVEREMPDILILDIGMPKMDGLQVLTELRNRGSHAKILAFSGFNGVVEREAVALGVDDYLRKGAAALEEIVPRLLALVA